jgi:hypothetical protein
VWCLPVGVGVSRFDTVINFLSWKLFLPKSFFQIGRLTLNLSAIAFVNKLANGGLRITTTVTRKDGLPASFLIPAGEHAEEFERQLSPYIAVRASNITVEGMPD